MQWRSKDWLDQPLHALVGASISLCIGFYTLWEIGAFLSILVAFVRESRQHHRMVLWNLDILFWLLGTTIGACINVFVL